MKSGVCGFGLQIHQFQEIRNEADKAYGDLISDTTEENRLRYNVALTDYLYAQLYLLVNLRHKSEKGMLEIGDNQYIVWDADWPHRVHVVNRYGRDRCERCHGHKLVEVESFCGHLWVECPECKSSEGKEYVSVYHMMHSKTKAS